MVEMAKSLEEQGFLERMLTQGDGYRNQPEKKVSRSRPYDDLNIFEKFSLSMDKQHSSAKKRPWDIEGKIDRYVDHVVSKTLLSEYLEGSDTQYVNAGMNNALTTALIVGGVPTVVYHAAGNGRRGFLAAGLSTFPFLAGCFVKNWIFGTNKPKDTKAPELYSFSPQDGRTDISNSIKPKVKFTEEITVRNYYDSIYLQTPSGARVSGTVQFTAGSIDELCFVPSGKSP